MQYKTESDFVHGSIKNTGVILVNLGTPEKPTSSSVRKYLRQFLSDRRIVEIPRVIWLFILHGIILRIRPKKSAEKYKSIWTAEGSPLRINTENQTKALSESMKKIIQPPLVIDYAMRYGEPTIESVILKQKRENVTNILN